MRTPSVIVKLLENIYKLCEEFTHKKDEGRGRLWAVFISNKNKSIPIWAHKEKADDPVVWDYHVILVEQKEEGSNSLVYDFDSTQHLSFPCNFITYVNKCLKPDLELRQAYKHAFRVIPAQEYITTFSSDRKHMINKETGDWMSPPPDYPPILQPGVSSNLHHFWTMDGPNTEVPGTIITDVKEFVKMFT